MGRYVEDTLMKGEPVLYAGKLSLRRYWLILGIGTLFLLLTVLGGLPMLVMSLFSKGSPGFGAALAMFMPEALIGALLVGWPFLVRYSTELAITDRRLIAKRGVLSTSSIEIRFDKIETVRVRQGLFGRLFNYGDIDIRGTGSSFDPITNIANPRVFKANLDQAMQTKPAAA